jgi:hypothetical protein
MIETCEGIFVAYKDGGDYVHTRYRCPETKGYFDIRPNVRFCPGCGKQVTEAPTGTVVPCRFVAQVMIDGEWEVVE